ncbi:MAG: hypothetical protein R3181_15090 [Rubricoccaceae bacterium]|nr:hypothetical protein [Rubricoccaceae bacterium]
MKLSLFVLIVLGTLALFNPSVDDFTVFIQERTRDVVSEKARALGGGLFGETTGMLTSRVAGAVAGGSIERESYGVLSLFAIDLNGTSEGGEWQFLGIGGQFFELERPVLVE